MFGLGGIYVEALRDVTFRIAPVDEREAARMLEALRGAPALGAMRGKPAVDARALVDVLGRLSRLALDFPEISELDINPMIAHPGGVLVVNARVALEPRPSKPASRVERQPRAEFSDTFSDIA